MEEDIYIPAASEIIQKPRIFTALHCEKKE